MPRGLKAKGRIGKLAANLWCGVRGGHVFPPTISLHDDDALVWFGKSSANCKELSEATSGVEDSQGCHSF